MSKIKNYTMYCPGFLETFKNGALVFLTVGLGGLIIALINVLIERLLV